MTTQTKINPAELGAKAEALFAANIKPTLGRSDQDKYVLIDVDSGAYEIGYDDLALEERLLANYPNASMVLIRADGGPTGHLGWPMTGE